MMNESMTRDFDAKMFQRRGSVAACTVLMIANTLAPAVALGDDGDRCHVRADYNCDQVVDGQDLGILLSKWGTRSSAVDLNGDCEIGGGDLGMMLATWGVSFDSPQLEPIQMNQKVVSICIGDSEIAGTISSELEINPDRSVFEGWATVSMGTDVFGTMAFSDGSVVITVGGTKVVINGDTAHDTMLVNSMPVDVDVFLQNFMAEIAADGLDVDRWSEVNQAIIMLGLLNNEESFTRAIHSQQLQVAAPGLWCKATCIGAAAIIVSLGAAGCAALTAGCAAGSVVTIGGLTIPCLFLIGLCSGGVFVAGGISYHSLLEFWN